MCAAVVGPDTLLPAAVAQSSWWPARVTVLPLLSFRRADCRRAATLAPGADYGAVLTKDQPVAEGRLTKAALVEEVAGAADLTKKHAEVIVETVLGGIVDALQRGEKVELRGFGSFRFRRRLPRKGRNPKTGDRVDVPSKRIPYFKPGKELKELINREQTQAIPPPLSDQASVEPQSRRPRPVFVGTAPANT